MITERDLEQAIAECQGERNPNANTCIKLAAFFTIKRAMFGEPEPNHQTLSTYSYAGGPAEQSVSTIDYYSGTDFSREIDGRLPLDIWPIMDELMSTLEVLYPKLYEGVMKKIRG